MALDIARIVGMAVRQAENHRLDQSLLHRSRDLGLREDVRGGFREMAHRVMHFTQPRQSGRWWSDAANERWRQQFAPNNGLPRGGKILGRQRHCTPSGGRRRSEVAFHMQPPLGNLTLRYFDSVHEHRGPVGMGREYNPRPSPAGRCSHNSRQILVEAARPQPRQPDDLRLRAELTMSQNETLVYVSYRRKIFIWVGKFADGARRHPLPLP